ncbi:hypothetical protein GWC95_09805 [Sediminibacterium roseum]|uniref:AhpC/TSA family protein n=1 Tax=Sediminibacterium roseum TaxID=1978412 RepID=A0ABW9ZW07_9BACT|nr:hypothetical protein [Sediminibacterium roseum]NCI50218.1 hypothetical protein [Sediminibacterium roseum]
MLKLSCVTAVIFILLSCSGRNRLNDVRKYMVPFAEANNLTIPLDSLGAPYYTPNSGVAVPEKFRVVNFINTDCGNCFARMEEWAAFLRDNEIEASIVFVASGSLNDYFTGFVASKKDLPFYIYRDSSNYILNSRGLHQYEKESFLIDQSKKILLVGNPVTNPVLFGYFKTVIDEGYY